MQTLFRPFSLNIQGRLHFYDKPVVMGIVNITPDSFFAGSRTMAQAEIASRVEMLVEQGAGMIDVGAYSSRPGAADVSAAEETERLRCGMEVIGRVLSGSDVATSVDTFRAEVARVAVEELGIGIVNDISGGMADPAMIDEVARMGVPYVLMHMRGTPATMQNHTDYGQDGVTATVLREMGVLLERAVQAGINDVIIDPGFGFAKTAGQNYELLRQLGVFQQLGRPVLAGLSRKSMITAVCGGAPADALSGTVAANTIALLEGAAILRVHDADAARQAIAVATETMKQPLYSEMP